MNDGDFRKLVSGTILSRLQPERRVDLPRLCDEIGLPTAVDDPALSKAQYIRSRVQLIDAKRLDAVAETFVARYPFTESGNRGAWEIQEATWNRRPAPEIPKKFRHQVARAIENVRLFNRGSKFLDALRRLWILEDGLTEALAELVGQPSHSLARQIERHVIQNDDWSVEDLFEALGAFDVSHRRFGRLLEALASADVRGEEENQRRFVELVNPTLEGCAVELRETGTDGGYPLFTLIAKGTSRGRPRNLIFASQVKPDIRFRDAISNDIEVVTNADKVLIYDRPIPSEGLRWRDLQTWWQEANGCDAEMAKKTLYRRLLSSLPVESPPQRHLFTSFFKIYGAAVPELPALLPEVWLHWDPKTVQERGPLALLRFRMDFLLLLADARIVVEVDGSQHYADALGRAAPERYSQMMAADRDLRLAGYEVYRFGATEFGDSVTATHRTKHFFDRLFRRHGLAR